MNPITKDTSASNDFSDCCVLTEILRKMNNPASPPVMIHTVFKIVPIPIISGGWLNLFVRIKAMLNPIGLVR